MRGSTALVHVYEIEAESEPEVADNVIPIGR